MTCVAPRPQQTAKAEPGYFSTFAFPAEPFHLPLGWELTHLILLDPEWQATLRSEEHVVVGTGPTIALALCAAIANAEAERYVGRLAHLPRLLEPLTEVGRGWLDSLGLGSKPVKRRKL